MMRSSSKGHARRSIRIPGYDYAQPGAYFVTICTYHHIHLFGNVINGEMQLNEYGKIVQFTWQDLINHIQGIELGEFIVMPNHTHAIIHIIGENLGAEPIRANSVGAGSKPAQTDDAKILRAGHGPALTKNMGDIRAGHGPTPTKNMGYIRAGFGPAPTKQKPLSEIVRELKTFSARRINEMRSTPGIPVWQRNYYEHIIRNEDDLRMITDYIATNPLNWAADELNLGNSPEM